MSLLGIILAVVNIETGTGYGVALSAIALCIFIALGRTEGG